MHSVSGI